MEKLLTVSVAAYNVEAYIRTTLESCVVPEILDELEVLIVDDGATDGTVRIAEEFCAEYPGTFRLIRKENGGYGSTVNRSMEEAKGRYFRLLDGDDYFDRQGLLSLMDAIRVCRSDWIITPIYRVPDGSDTKELHHASWESCIGHTYEMKNLPCDCIVGMWHVTVRTDVLREHPFRLPEHTLYTDQQFVLYMMPYIKTLTFLKDPLYCYRIGRDGQSVSRESRIRHSDETVDSMARMLRFYVKCLDITSENRKPVTERTGMYLVFAVLTLLLGGISRKRFLQIGSLMGTARKYAPEVYRDALRRSDRLKLLHYTGGLAYLLMAGHVKNWV